MTWPLTAPDSHSCARAVFASLVCPAARVAGVATVAVLCCVCCVSCCHRCCCSELHSADASLVIECSRVSSLCFIRNFNVIESVAVLIQTKRFIITIHDSVRPHRTKSRSTRFRRICAVTIVAGHCTDRDMHALIAQRVELVCCQLLD